jgi:uncharacterized membrane protein YphA (DoxX/SURF4 family)
MDNLKGYLAPLGRLLMSSLFIWAGYHKLINPGGTAQYFAMRTCQYPTYPFGLR